MAATAVTTDPTAPVTRAHEGLPSDGTDGQGTTRPSVRRIAPATGGDGQNKWQAGEARDAARPNPSSAGQIVVDKASAFFYNTGLIGPPLGLRACSWLWRRI
jgi:hypothetical protein